MKLSYLSSVAALAAVCVVGCSKKEASDDVVATVNGESISATEYHDLLERKSTVIVSTPQGPQLAQTYGTVGFQGLRDAIDRKLVFQLAKEDNLLPTDADVSAELDQRSKETPNYANLMISQAGLTMKLLRQDIMFDLARERLLTKGVVVGMPEVEQFIKENPQQFMEPAKANLLVIVVSDPKKKQQVDQDLATGQNFQTVATRYSEMQQARETGGAFPENRVDRMPKQLQDLVARTPKLKATNWIQDGKNWIKFYVQDKTPAKEIEMTPEKKKQLQRQLAMRRGQQVNDLARRLQDKLKTSDVKVNPPHLNQLWTRMMDAQKAAAASAPAPGGAPAGGANPGAGNAPAGGAPATGGTAPAPGGAKK